MSRLSPALIAASCLLEGVWGPAASEKPEAVAVTVRPQMSSLTLPFAFEENRGQVDDRVRFFARGPSHTLFLTGAESILVLRRADRSRVMWRMHLAGAEPSGVEGLEEREATSYYLVAAERSGWVSGALGYGRVVYRDAYENVDLAYHGNPHDLDYEFVVRPGGDPAAIRLRYEGADRLEITAAGDLVVYSGDAWLRTTRPRMSQELPDGTHRISGGYEITPEGDVALVVGDYDRTRVLVIDPHVIY